MSQQELVARLAAGLAAAGVEYLATGSLVSSWYGEPRATHDLDVVVSLHREQLPVLAQAFPEPEYYLDAEAASAAIADCSMFNVIDVAGGYKIDFWLLSDSPFDRSRFTRRRPARIGGTELWVATPEDLILSKLRWAKDAGGSEKQLADALRVYEVQFGALDRGYLEHWAAALGVHDLWSRLQAEAAPPRAG